MSERPEGGQDALTSWAGVRPSHFISSVARWNASQDSSDSRSVAGVILSGIYSLYASFKHPAKGYDRDPGRRCRSPGTGGRTASVRLRRGVDELTIPK